MKRCRQCGAPAESRVDGLCSGCQELKAHPDPLSKITHFGKIPFEDFKQLDEPARFKRIAQHLNANPGRLVAVMVDTGPGHQDKGDRWIRAVRALVPGVLLMGRRPGPVANTETISFQLNKQN